MINYRNTIKQINKYIPGKPIDEVKREYHIDEVIKLASNENPYGCSPKAKELLHSIEDVEIYPDGNCTILRNALSKKLHVQPDQLIFGAGSDELLGLIPQVFMNPDNEAITCIPSFQKYITSVQLMDAKLIGVPLKNHAFDLDGILGKITSKTKVIFIANPNNPTGTMFTAGQQTAFLDKVPSDILVVLDEAYYEYVKNEEYPNSLDMLSKYPNLIILRTFSKAYGLASLRIGYGIASQEIIELLNRIRNPFNVTTSAQEAAIASLNDKDFVAMTAENNLKVKLYIYEQFEKMGLPYISTEGNFIMIDTKKDSKEMFEKLLREGIVVRPGFYFGMDTWLRVTIGTKEQMEMFMKALSRLI